MFGNIKRGFLNAGRKIVALGKQAVKSVGYGLQVVGAATGVSELAGHAHAQTDIPSTITALGGYETTALAIGVPVLLWAVGRMLVHKMTRG
jgi:hypothetical protein